MKESPNSYQYIVVFIILITCIYQFKVIFVKQIPPQITSALTRSLSLEQSASRDEPNIILIQSDTRPLEKSTLEYYNAVLLSYYAYLHGYTFIRFDPAGFCDEKKKKECKGHEGTEVHPIWTKVAAMQMAMKYAREGDLIFFIDSDATMDVTALHLPAHLAAPSIGDWINKPDKSILVPCDCYSFWTQVAHNVYGLPVNTGLLGLKARPRTLHILDVWWKSMEIVTPLQEWWNHDFRKQWPYEQERLTWMINTGDYVDDIDVIQKKMRNPDLKGLFSHGPNNKNSKTALGEVSKRSLVENFDCLHIERPFLKNMTDIEIVALLTIRDSYRNPGNLEISYPEIHKGPDKDKKRRILEEIDRVYKREYITKLADAFGLTEEQLEAQRRKQLDEYKRARVQSFRDRPKIVHKSSGNEPNPQEVFREELDSFEASLTVEVCASTDRESDRWYDIISEFLLKKVNMIEISPKDLEELDVFAEWKK